jgi:hypothetical protein
MSSNLLCQFLNTAVPADGGELLHGVTLVVDAAAFLWNICRKQISLKMHIAFGEYNILHHIIVKEVEYFRQCNLNLMFIFDGSTQMKRTTNVNCFDENSSRCEDLISACQNQYSKKELPLPPLAVMQLKDSLTSIGIRWYQHESEANHFIASMCCDYNATVELGKETCFCLGASSRRCL